MDPELLFKVSPGLDRENTSVYFLMEHVLGLLGAATTFEECEGPEDFLLFIVELLGLGGCRESRSSKMHGCCDILC